MSNGQSFGPGRCVCNKSPINYQSNHRFKSIKKTLHPNQSHLGQGSHDFKHVIERFGITPTVAHSVGCFPNLIHDYTKLLDDITLKNVSINIGSYILVKYPPEWQQSPTLDLCGGREKYLPSQRPKWRSPWGCSLATSAEYGRCALAACPELGDGWRKGFEWEPEFVVSYKNSYPRLHKTQIMM